MPFEKHSRSRGWVELLPTHTHTHRGNKRILQSCRGRFQQRTKMDSPYLQSQLAHPIRLSSWAQIGWFVEMLFTHHHWNVVIRTQLIIGMLHLVQFLRHRADDACLGDLTKSHVALGQATRTRAESYLQQTKKWTSGFRRMHIERGDEIRGLQQGTGQRVGVWRTARQQVSWGLAFCSRIPRY